MLLLNTAAHATLQRHTHPNLGRLCVPGCHSRMADSLATQKVGFDNGCFHGLDPIAVCRMYQSIAGWPTLAARLGALWPGMRYASAEVRRPEAPPAVEPALPGDLTLPEIHPNLLWCTVPDVVRCACGNTHHCRPSEQTDACAPRGDADLTRERFDVWAPFLAHLPLAYVLQDGAEKPGRVPWDCPPVKALFVGGSDAWRYGPECAALIGQARNRGLHVHFGRISSKKRIRYAASVGATSFDSSRYSRWRDLLLDDGLHMAAAGQQMRLVA